MNKKDMITAMIDFGYYSPVVSEYKAYGYTDEGAKKKTAEWYSKHLTKAEVKELYDDFVWTHSTWF